MNESEFDVKLDSVIGEINRAARMPKNTELEAKDRAISLLECHERLSVLKKGGVPEPLKAKFEEAVHILLEDGFGIDYEEEDGT